MKLLNPLCLTVGTLMVASLVGAQSQNQLIPAADGGITLTPITHASLQLEYAGQVIHVDPWSQGEYANAKQADLVLVTDIHGDHLDPDAIARVRKAGAPVVVPEAAAPKVENPTIMANGDRMNVAGIPIEAVPMYNIERGPEPGQLYHTKGRGNGYIITLGGTRLYFSGDTECVPEIRALTGVHVAFMTMNLPYTMPPLEAADCVKAFQPKMVYPYHYQGANLEEFREAVRGEPIEVRLLDWYPGQ
jgi:L-ascorbate metabolism protein UlaG (beta-lactamase superfamily)